MVELSIHFGHHDLVFAQCEPIFEVIRAIGEVDIRAILKRCVENVVKNAIYLYFLGTIFRLFSYKQAKEAAVLNEII